jgi:FkbM family methyltransferase
MSVLLRRVAGRIGDKILPGGELSQLPEIRHLRKVLIRYGVDCVFDVGANVGQYANMLRRRVGFKGVIISFEPTPQLYAQLHDRFRTDRRWHGMNLALTDRDGRASFSITADGQFSSLKQPSTAEVRFLSRHQAITQAISVECRRLDSLYHDLQRRFPFKRPFLKMDTQGNDLQVFTGASGIINEMVGLQSELSFKRLYQDSPLFSESIATYLASGFELSALVPNNDGHFPHLIEMDCIMLNNRFL